MSPLDLLVKVVEAGRDKVKDAARLILVDRTETWSGRFNDLVL